MCGVTCDSEAPQAAIRSLFRFLATPSLSHRRSFLESRGKKGQNASKRAKKKTTKRYARDSRAFVNGPPPGLRKAAVQVDDESGPRTNDEKV